ncbi:4-hydroxyphenylacetate decarboxylase small subunit [Moorella naiadis]|uniref:4-hydroxyphenylacetate decarboxylase small subunit n=1 Tax=Moorella naiadis (nom. illeg.) TaxID=3093670 RepID=UPI003D9C95A5
MSNETSRHNDCRNFVPVDVAKGICRVRNELIAIDTPTCQKFDPLPKCKNCANFTATENTLGVCEADKNKPWAFEDLIAVTCAMYRAQ